MIRVYILDTGGMEAEKFYPTDLTPHILEARNSELKRQRIFAYILLSYAYRDSFSADLPDIIYSAYGRPSFNNVSVDFNISHTSNMVALIISDEKRVGIDIESVGKGVSDRLVQSVFEITKKPEFIAKRAEACELILDKIAFLSLSTSGEILPSGSDFLFDHPILDERINKDLEFKSDWTLLEALVKMDGRGIGAIKNTAPLLIGASIKSLLLSDTSATLYSLTAVSL